MGEKILPVPGKDLYAPSPECKASEAALCRNCPMRALLFLKVGTGRDGRRADEAGNRQTDRCEAPGKGGRADGALCPVRVRKPDAVGAGVSGGKTGNKAASAHGDAGADRGCEKRADSSDNSRSIYCRFSAGMLSGAF